jgi:hypothetical protein
MTKNQFPDLFSNNAAKTSVFTGVTMGMRLYWKHAALGGSGFCQYPLRAHQSSLRFCRRYLTQDKRIRRLSNAGLIERYTWPQSLTGSNRYEVDL